MCARKACWAGAEEACAWSGYSARAVLVAVLLVLLAASAPWWVSAYILGVLTIAYYFGVFAMSWDLLFGFAGEVNFGPTFLIGLGAYGSGHPEQRSGTADPALPRLRAC